MAQVADIIEKYGLPKLIASGTALLGIAVFSFFMLSKISTPEMGLLYGDLEVVDASRVTSRLEGMGVPFELRGGGTQVYAPLDQVGRLRMEMAEAGLPMGGSIGYEIFDKGDTLGTTSFVQNINRIRAMEGELSRTIETIAAVSAARVHLVMPNKSVFSRDQEEPRASVVLRLHGPGRLSRQKVASIQHMVSSAVSGLSPDRISIVDDRGTLLLKGDKAGTGAFPSDVDEARFEYERRLSNSIETLISRTVGVGKVRAEVTADLDFDRITESKESFDPEGQVLRQASTVEEGQDAQEGTASAVSAGQNVPQEEAEGGAAGNQQKSNRTEESVSYEISKTIRNHIHESGGIKRLSVAVLVDGSYGTGEKGEETYAGRTEEEMENIRKLVRSTIGFNDKRGDQVEVINMRFAPEMMAEGVDDNSLVLGMERHHIVRLAEMLLLVLFGFLALQMVIKPFLNMMFYDTKKKIKADYATDHPDEVPEESLELPEIEVPQTQIEVRAPAKQVVGDDLTAMIDLKRVEGKVRASSVKKIGEMVTDQPTEAVNIVRNWLNG